MAIPLSPIQNNQLAVSAIRQKQPIGHCKLSQVAPASKSYPRHSSQPTHRALQFWAEVDALTEQGGTVREKGRIRHRKGRCLAVWRAAFYPYRKPAAPGKLVARRFIGKRDSDRPPASTVLV